MHSIGHVAKTTGLKIPTIRFYEQEGLLRAPARLPNGRRVYSDTDIRRLIFIRHSRDLGFELEDVKSMLELADRPELSCEDADEIARRHLMSVEQRISQLLLLKTELSRIARACSGGGSAGECRVIEALAGHEGCASQHGRALRGRKKG